MPIFTDIIEQLPILLRKLEAMPFVERENVRRMLPKKGIYVFYEGLKPIYVGRSKSIADRVLRHGRRCGRHNSATFAFLLAKEKAHKMRINTQLTRKELEQDTVFSKLYGEAKEKVAKMKIKAVKIDDNETQAIFEIYASKKLETKYNDFATH